MSVLLQQELNWIDSSDFIKTTCSKTTKKKMLFQPKIWVKYGQTKLLNLKIEFEANLGWNNLAIF